MNKQSRSPLHLQDSLSVVADPEGRQSVMQARIGFLEMTNAELEEKLGQTEEMVKNLEAEIKERDIQVGLKLKFC